MKPMEDSGSRRETIGPHVDGLTLEQSNAKRIDETVADARVAAERQLRTSGGYFSRPKRAVAPRAVQVTPTRRASSAS